MRPHLCLGRIVWRSGLVAASHRHGRRRTPRCAGQRRTNARATRLGVGANPRPVLIVAFSSRTRAPHAHACHDTRRARRRGCGPAKVRWWRRTDTRRRGAERADRGQRAERVGRTTDGAAAAADGGRTANNRSIARRDNKQSTINAAAEIPEIPEIPEIRASVRPGGPASSYRTESITVPGRTVAAATERTALRNVATARPWQRALAAAVPAAQRLFSFPSVMRQGRPGTNDGCRWTSSFDAARRCETLRRCEMLEALAICRPRGRLHGERRID